MECAKEHRSCSASEEDNEVKQAIRRGIVLTIVVCTSTFPSISISFRIQPFPLAPTAPEPLAPPAFDAMKINLLSSIQVDIDSLRYSLTLSKLRLEVVVQIQEILKHTSNGFNGCLNRIQGNRFTSDGIEAGVCIGNPLPALFQKTASVACRFLCCCDGLCRVSADFTYDSGCCCSTL